MVYKIHSVGNERKYSVTKVNGVARNIVGYYKAEDTVSAAFSFESDVVGSGSWCFVVDEKSEEDSIEIHGTTGKIKFSCFDLGNVELTTKEGTQKFSFTNPENISFLLVQQLVGALQGKNDCVSTMYSAARTNYVLEEIVKSYYSK